MIFKRIEQHIKVARWAPRSWVASRVSSHGEALRSFGTAYGRGTVVDDDRLNGGHFVLCGAGEDISFDLEVQRQFNGTVQIVDPTPRAVSHVEDVLRAGATGELGKTFTINGSEVAYNFAGIDFSKIELVTLGIWNEPTVLRFFAPKDPRHVSYSIVNLQDTDDYIEVKTTTLDKIASRPIDLLKLNIEGAEIEVLVWLASSDLRPRQILVVFDELHTPSADSADRVKRAVTALLDGGYRLVHFDGHGICLFLFEGQSPQQVVS